VKIHHRRIFDTNLHIYISELLIISHHDRRSELLIRNVKIEELKED